jgi:hypothetical protein
MAVEIYGNKSPDGANFGQSTSDKIGFYGLTTPIVQPSGAAQTAITDGSTGTANPATGVAALTGTYNSTLLINAFATIVAQTNAMRSALVALNLIKGAA